MNRLVTCLIWLALFIAGLIGISLSAVLQTPTVILLGLAGVLASIGLLKTRDLEVENKGLYICALVALLFFVWRACTSPVLDLGLQDLLLILSAGLMYLVGGHAACGKPGVMLRQGLAWVVITLLLLHIGASITQIGGGEGYSLSRYFTSAQRSSSGRVTGMYSYYGSFANFTVISGLLCLSLGVWGRMRYLFRGLLFLLGVVSLALAVGAHSRSAAMSLVVALAVYGVLIFVSLAQQRNKVRKQIGSLLIVLSVIGVLLGGIGGYMVFKNRSDSTIGMEMVFDAGVRLPFWSMAVEQWSDYPVVGAGSRSYSYECFRYWNPNLGTESGNPEFVHNEYLQLLADYGLIGLLLILILMGWHLFIATKRIRCLSLKVGEDGLKRGSNAMALSIAGVSGMVAMAVHITFDFRTHLLANLLLLVCCSVWGLPLARQRSTGGQGNVTKWLIACPMLLMGLGATYLGGTQLGGGWPLVENRMAKEDGAWEPDKVPRDKWIPILEETVGRAPHFIRYQRLGALYQLEAEGLEGDLKDQVMVKAKSAYKLSIERHAHNPIPWINLAAIYSAESKFLEADATYVKAAELAKSREHWFRMHMQWGKLHREWADLLWRQGELDDAGEHFVVARALYLKSRELAKPRDDFWRSQYLVTIYGYIRFLDSCKRFEESLTLLKECESIAGVARPSRVYADHLLRQAEHLWYSRNPSLALRKYIDARSKLLYCKKWYPSSIDEGWGKSMNKVDATIKFLRKAGVQAESK